MNHPQILAVAKKHSRTPVQILMRWALQHRIIAIPKSVRKERILQNSQVFDFVLTPDDMKALDSLNEDFRTCWDPTDLA